VGVHGRAGTRRPLSPSTVGGGRARRGAQRALRVRHPASADAQTGLRAAHGAGRRHAQGHGAGGAARGGDSHLQTGPAKHHGQRPARIVSGALISASHSHAPPLRLCLAPFHPRRRLQRPRAQRLNRRRGGATRQDRVNFLQKLSCMKGVTPAKLIFLNQLLNRHEHPANTVMWSEGGAVEQVRAVPLHRSRAAPPAVRSLSLYAVSPPPSRLCARARVYRCTSSTRANGAFTAASRRTPRQAPLRASGTPPSLRSSAVRRPAGTGSLALSRDGLDFAGRCRCAR